MEQLVKCNECNGRGRVNYSRRCHGKGKAKAHADLDAISSAAGARH